MERVVFWHVESSIHPLSYMALRGTISCVESQLLLHSIHQKVGVAGQIPNFDTKESELRFFRLSNSSFTFRNQSLSP